jgi:hypothetical protein
LDTSGAPNDSENKVYENALALPIVRESVEGLEAYSRAQVAHLKKRGNEVQQNLRIALASPVGTTVVFQALRITSAPPLRGGNNSEAKQLQALAMQGDAPIWLSITVIQSFIASRDHRSATEVADSMLERFDTPFIYYRLVLMAYERRMRELEGAVNKTAIIPIPVRGKEVDFKEWARLRKAVTNLHMKCDGTFDLAKSQYCSSSK